MADKIPQPKVYPIVKNVLELDTDAPVQSMMRLAQEFGGIYKLEMGDDNAIIISDPDLVNEVCDETRFDKKVHRPLEKIRDFAGDGLFTAYTQEANWEKAHRILVPAFGPSAIKSMFPQMLDIAEQLLLKWERLGENTTLDVPDNMTRLTLDTIALCAFDYRFNSFYSKEMHPFVNAMVNALHEASLYNRRLPIQNKLMFITKRNYEQEIKLLKSVASEIISSRRKQPKEEWSKDLLSLMLEGKDPITNESLDDENIMNQMITFLIAGHETTSGLLSFAFYLLLKNPEKLQKAQEQVDEVLKSEIPTFEHLNKLTYIDQVLKETLRLWPTAPLFGLSAYEDTVIGGKYEIKKEDTILVLLPTLHRNKKIWSGDIEAFMPERFETQNTNQLPPNVYKPFGNGQRACIGRPFALQEAILVMAMVLQRFDLSLANPNYELKVKETLTLKPDDFFIKVKRRDIVINTSHQGNANKSKTVEQIQQTTNSHHMPLLVLFGSNSGSCQDFAYKISTDATAQGYDAKMASLDTFAGNLPTEGAIIIVAASYEGQPTDNAKKFVNWLKTEQTNSLQGVQYAVLGCGNRDWARTYQAIPTFIDNRLNELGATRLFARGEADAKNDFFGDFDRWYEPIWNQLGNYFNLSVNTDASTHYSVEFVTDTRAKFLGETEMQEGIIIANKELVNMTAPNARSKRHIEIALPQGMNYTAGDYLKIIPINNREKVDKILSQFHLDYDTQIVINTDKAHTHFPTGLPISVGELLSNYVELNSVATLKQIKTLVGYTQCPPEKIRLEQLTNDEVYKKEVLAKRMSLADILQLNPACTVPLEVLLEMLPALKSRQYSISSSPLWNEKHCTLTIAVVNEPAFSGIGNYTGTASTYLANIKAGSKVLVQVKKSDEAFHLPPNATQPIIMICAGSGLAPFRGFIQERALQKKNGVNVGESLLFFGCDARDVDFLYQEELQEYENLGVVAIKPAFSITQEQGIAFVQHRVWQDKEEIKKLFQQGATIYLCGDGKYMAPAVRETLIKIYAEIIDCDFETASQRWLQEVEQKHRFVVDIFA
ncbi:MAG: cytochrome P450 [Chitinophagales bacterium]|nr:cytochrome P450 [Chitinophagales bacterium]